MSSVTSGTNAVRLLRLAIAFACVGLFAACSGGGGGNGGGNNAPTMQSIEVTPANPRIAAGTTTQLTATAIFSDSSRKNVTAQVTWSSSNTAAATISNASGRNGMAAAAAAGGTTASATQNGVTGQTTLTVTPAVLVSIEVTPPASGIAKGTTTQFAATGVFSDKSTQDLTAQVTWSSSNATVATVSNSAGSNGRVSTATVGNTGISASLNGITSPPAALTVTAAMLVNIQVTPPNPTLANGLTEQFTATGVYTDGSTQNLTSAVSWSSSNTAAAAISNAAGSNGLASAAGVGTTYIAASLNGVTSPNASLTVTAATLVAMQITPPSFSVPNGLTEQFTATGVYTDGSTQNLTSVATWSSSNPGVATVSNAAGSNGLASAATVGNTNISAALNGVTAPSAALTVTAATLVSLQVTPPNPGIANGLTQQFTATGTYTDNSTLNLTSAVTWSSSNPAAASISNAAGSNGLASALGMGSTYISAALGPVVSPNVTLTVTQATLVSIQVTPPSASIANGLTEQFTAMGIYTDNSTQNLTSVVTWASSTPSVASISNAASSNGLASALALGATDISASFGGVTSPSAPLTVSAATLVSIAVTPASQGIANGLTQQFTATGTYTDSSTQDLTSAVTWSSSDTAVAAISNASGSNGLAWALAVGTTSISASLGSVVSPNAALTVTGATLASIQVSPSSASIANGLTQQFTATGTYTDNSTHDLTQAVTWSSSNGGLASISNAAGSNGLASALALGTTEISASFNGVTSPSAPLTVSAATLVSIQVTPANLTIADNATQQFTATGLYTDGTQVNLTSAVTWFSSSSGVASISNAVGSNGLASASGVGTTSISASFNGVTSPSAALTVRPSLEQIEGVWTDDPQPGTNQMFFIADASGNFSAGGLYNGQWIGYSGILTASGSGYTGTVAFDPVGGCETCHLDTYAATGPTPSANVTVMVSGSTLTFSDTTNSYSWTFTYLSDPLGGPATTLVQAQSVWPNPVNDCASPITIASDVPALGIYRATCSGMYSTVTGTWTDVGTGIFYVAANGDIVGIITTGIGNGMIEDLSFAASACPAGSSGTCDAAGPAALP